jgi:hypothetical protein
VRRLTDHSQRAVAASTVLPSCEVAGCRRGPPLATGRVPSVESSDGTPTDLRAPDISAGHGVSVPNHTCRTDCIGERAAMRCRPGRVVAEYGFEPGESLDVHRAPQVGVPVGDQHHAEIGAAAVIEGDAEREYGEAGRIGEQIGGDIGESTTRVVLERGNEELKPVVFRNSGDYTADGNSRSD